MGRVLLMGQHGSGKSRMATNTAAERLRAGRPGLFVRLSAWNTGLESLLERALSAAAGEPLDRHALEGYLARRSSFVIFDSLDEVPATSRASAGEEIGQFAQAHPWLDVTVTARYQITATELQGWRVLELAPLTREQAEQALGRPLRDLQLPSGIEALVTNPLMLGFVKADVDAGRKPESEADLLNTYVDELIVRQSRRPPKLDTTSGWRLAEEVAWAWLATGRIGLSRQEVRAMSSTVARELSVSGFLHLDAATVEHWFVECGLAAIVGDLGLPAHRTILDHLAGRSVPRHPPRPDQVRDELREAIARYVGSLAELDDLALGYLDALGTDLEFLARCAHLVQSDINWPFAPEEFANSYVAALRQLSAGPLAAVGVVPPTVRIQIDPALSWVFEEEFAGPTDIVQIVPEPPRMYFSIGDGPRVPVKAFRGGGSQGRDIAPRVPHIAAFNRAKEELEHRLHKRLLRDEGPDIVYERLSGFATRSWEVLSVYGSKIPPEFDRAQMENATARGLQEMAVEWLSRMSKRRLSSADLEGALVAWRNPSLLILLDAEPDLDDPYDYSQGRGGLAIHFQSLVRLAALAEKLGIADVPLHPLGLRPESLEDSVRQLPDRVQLLDEEQVRVFITRHQLAEMRAIRHVTETNFSGLADRIDSYATLPWRVSISISPPTADWAGDWSIEGHIERHAAMDEVVFVDDLGEQWSFRTSMLSEHRVSETTYRALAWDLKNLLGGNYALGRRDL